MMLVISLCICLSIQCAFYALYLHALEVNSFQDISSEEKGLSIVIAARNEAENLKRNLPLILNQDYQNFEIILLDHDSSDDTKLVMESFKDEKLRTFTLNRKDYPYKKHVIDKGIHEAKNDNIVLTDADCTIISSNWLSITNQHLDSHDIVLGYSPYFSCQGFLNKLIRFETVMIGALYLSLARFGQPYMGVGRNMAYKKDLFIKGDGFASHAEVLSGDDDLFVQENANAQNTTICLNKDHFTYSQAKPDWTSYWNQKKRHLSTSPYYKLRHKIVLSIFPLATILFWTLLVISALFLSNYSLLIVIMTVKILFQFISFKKISKVLGEKDLLIIAPFLELITVIYNGFVALALLVSKKIEWK